MGTSSRDAYENFEAHTIKNVNCKICCPEPPDILLAMLNDPKLKYIYIYFRETSRGDKYENLVTLQ